MAVISARGSRRARTSAPTPVPAQGRWARKAVERRRHSCKAGADIRQLRRAVGVRQRCCEAGGDIGGGGVELLASGSGHGNRRRRR
jgi:hypothetical protein